MFAAAQQQQVNQQPEEQDQLKPQPLTAEEEALKRNTDCVYFLASPLTCKKGSECEYRHSEYARVNPRDCYYWLNGNCLNPKCGFRHPPLDGLLGTQVAAGPAGGPVIASHPAVPVTAHAPYGSSAPSGSSKPAVPCIFFQKGYCLKGDRCAFLHGPVPMSTKVPPAATPPNPISGPPAALKKTFGVPEKSTQQQQKILLPHEPRRAPKVETVNKRYVPTHTGLNDEVPRYKPTNIPPGVNGSSLVRANLSEQSYNYAVKDTEEHLRESSPGFDVLVDDELGASEYYSGRNGNEYDLGCSANYDAPADADREMFRDTRGYDSYDRMQGQYDLDQRRSSVGSGHMERRGYSKPGSPERIAESDLRYRLSKHRRGNGLRSVVTHDHAPENRGSSRRDSHRHESSLSSRLRGRIKLPGRSPDNTDSRSEIERGRSRGRVSPTRPGRLRERIKGRVEEEFNSNLPRMSRREITDPNFAAPKRLSELKVVDNKEHQGLRKRKALEDHHHQSEGNDLSFDGPMPLCEILKRKRQAKTEDANQKTTRNIPEEKPEVTEVESSQQVLSDHEVEDGMIVEEVVEEVPELEGEEQKEEEYGVEEYYYEQGDEGEYNYEEDGENVVDPEEEYLEEDEDGDDFAKKIGVVLS